MPQAKSLLVLLYVFYLFFQVHSQFQAPQREDQAPKHQPPKPKRSLADEDYELIFELTYVASGNMVNVTGDHVRSSNPYVFNEEEDECTYSIEGGATGNCVPEKGKASPMVLWVKDVTPGQKIVATLKIKTTPTNDFKKGPNFYLCIFASLHDLVEVKILRFNPNESTTNVAGIFKRAKNLKKITFEGTCNLNSVENFDTLAWDCISLEEFDMSVCKSEKGVNNLNRMFDNCPNIKRINMGNLNTLDEASGLDAKGFLNGCVSLCEIIYTGAKAFGDNSYLFPKNLKPTVIHYDYGELSSSLTIPEAQTNFGASVYDQETQTCLEMVTEITPNPSITGYDGQTVKFKLGEMPEAPTEDQTLELDVTEPAGSGKATCYLKKGVTDINCEFESKEPLVEKIDFSKLPFKDNKGLYTTSEPCEIEPSFFKITEKKNDKYDKNTNKYTFDLSYEMSPFVAEKEFTLKLDGSDEVVTCVTPKTKEEPISCSFSPKTPVDGTKEIKISSEQEIDGKKYGSFGELDMDFGVEHSFEIISKENDKYDEKENKLLLI